MCVCVCVCVCVCASVKNEIEKMKYVSLVVYLHIGLTSIFVFLPQMDKLEIGCHNLFWGLFVVFSIETGILTLCPLSICFCGVFVVVVVVVYNETGILTRCSFYLVSMSLDQTN